MSSWFPKPFSKCRYLVMNKIPELERALEAINSDSILQVGDANPERERDPTSWNSALPNRGPNILLGTW